MGLPFLGSGKSKTVLLADDDKKMVRLLELTLRSNQRINILHAFDGTSALSMARREKPDLVLLDVRMPKRNGYEVCRTLKDGKETAKIKVVMLTAMDNKEQRKEAKKAGASDFIAKPFDPRSVLKTIEKMLSL